MIRQNKKMLLLTSIITLLPVFIGLFVESITRFCCNTFWTKQSAGRIFIQSLCSIWPASDSAGSSFSMCGRNKH